MGPRRSKRNKRYRKIETPNGWYKKDEGVEGETDMERDQERKEQMKFLEQGSDREVRIQLVEGGAEKKGETKHMGLAFQVADVKKFFLAVKRCIEKGNHVTFGPKSEDNYIINKKPQETR